MAARIGKRFTFEAAHHLPDHDGKCRRPHGHSYVVEATFLGEPIYGGPKNGMVVDFGDVSSFWKGELEPVLDHRDLNDSIDVDVTTAERIAEWIWERFEDRFACERVRVWETATSWAEWPA